MSNPEMSSSLSMENNNTWLQRLLNRFQSNPLDSVNPDEWISSLLDKPIADTNISQNVRQTATVLDLLLENSPDPDLSTLIDDLLESSNEGSVHSPESNSKTEQALSHISSNEANRAIPTILNALLKWENEFYGQNASAAESSSEVKPVVPKECWIDILLNKSTLPRNVSGSDTWLTNILDAPSNIPSHIPKMDFTPTSALQHRKFSQ